MKNPPGAASRAPGGYDPVRGRCRQASQLHDGQDRSGEDHHAPETRGFLLVGADSRTSSGKFGDTRVEGSAMAAGTHRDDIRFPSELSVRITGEIEATAGEKS